MRVIHALSMTLTECQDMVKTVEDMRAAINNLEPSPTKSTLRRLCDNLLRDLTYREVEPLYKGGNYGCK